MKIRTHIPYGVAFAVALCGVALAESSVIQPKIVHHCASAATDQARKLLAFHFGRDDRIEIEQRVRTLHPIRNPANRAQLLDVLEVWGRIYKGQYRMRLIYAQTRYDCVLIGQEILEYASL
jgi:hypothetical protein